MSQNMYIVCRMSNRKKHMLRCFKSSAEAYQNVSDETLMIVSKFCSERFNYSEIK